ncbi:hypothetical protein Efla_007521 [Eimeria flavescens]
MTKLFQRLVDRAAANIIHAQAQQQFYANQHREPAEFAMGDRVWVSTRYMQPRGSAKFQLRFIGPFTIVSKIAKVAYELDLPATMQMHSVFYLCLLQKDKPRPTKMLPPQGWEPAEEALKGTEPCYEVEPILYSLTRKGTEEYLLKWKGYLDEDVTWEPIQHLDRCKDLLRAIRAKRSLQRRRTYRELRSGPRCSVMSCNPTCELNDVSSPITCVVTSASSGANALVARRPQCMSNDRVHCMLDGKVLRASCSAHVEGWGMRGIEQRVMRMLDSLDTWCKNCGSAGRSPASTNARRLPLMPDGGTMCVGDAHVEFAGDESIDDARTEGSEETPTSLATEASPARGDKTKAFLSRG